MGTRSTSRAIDAAGRSDPTPVGWIGSGSESPLLLAGAARGSLDVRGLARPLLEEITAITDETSTLSLPATHDLLTIDFVASTQSVRSVVQVGRNSVAHATAVGQVLLAWGGTLPEGELTRYTDRTTMAAGRRRSVNARTTSTRTAGCPRTPA
ncbi:MAG: hypothetical protein L0I24_15075 [Pseudonocardia sp.]|nr:hypothetical protein [Pseudonocardia sp.]